LADYFCLVAADVTNVRDFAVLFLIKPSTRERSEISRFSATMKLVCTLAVCLATRY